MKRIKKFLKINKKPQLLCRSLYLVFFSVTAQGVNWEIEPSHSKINFDISYFRVGDIKGNFEKNSGSFTVEEQVISGATVSIKPSSITTNADRAKHLRSKHLRSKDFFNVEQQAEIKLISTSITKTKAYDSLRHRNISMSGITKANCLKGDKGRFVHPRFKTTNKIMSITNMINPEDFNVTINYPPEKFALGNDVILTAELHLIKEN